MTEADGGDVEQVTFPRRAVLLSVAASAVGLVACRENPSAGGGASPSVSVSGSASASAIDAGAISPSTFAEAEKIALVENTPAARALLVADAGALHDRVRALRDHPLASSLVPASVFDPHAMTAPAAARTHASIRATRVSAVAPPKDDDDIAFAPLTVLGEWLRTKTITSTKLTEIHLDRLRRFGPKLECVVTLTPELAMQQAKAADAAIAKGQWRGLLHGVTWGAKDLLDTAGIATTWGAAPFRARVPTTDATVVKRLADAGAVLVAKLSMGELAKDDVWFGGKTRNPWNTDEGSRGSSAGSGAAVAAGLCAFAMGSETMGSIVAPSTRCGVAGLRPTFGRVSRTGAMTLCWSMDKLGPMARTVEDTMHVLAAIAGPDGVDFGARAAPLAFDAGASLALVKIGYVAASFEHADATDVDRAALAAAKRIGLALVPIELPKLPYDSLNHILQAECAASFEDLVRDGRVNELREQHKDAWPNFLREARFLSAVDLVRAERLRREVMRVMAELFAHVDAILHPCLVDPTTLVSNLTGHPSLTLRAGFLDSQGRGFEGDDTTPPLSGAKRSVPQGVTLTGRLFDEGTLVRIGMALESELGVWSKRPTLA